NTEFDSSYLLVDNEENLPTFASLPEPIDETQTNVRRSSRPRTKNKRLSSFDSNERVATTTTTTHKKRKKIEKIVKNE
ncbi:unnamed protein product, partial [Adineta steineri]